MLKKIRHQHLHYFSKHPSRGLRELYWSVGLMNLGISAVTLFEPIFLFTQGYTLIEIMFFYLLVYLLYAVLLPFAGQLIGKIGYEHSILYSHFFLVAYYLFLFAISKDPIFFYLAPVAFALQKSFYWPAYHADFMLFSNDQQRGREIGGIETLAMVTFIIGPILGGVILEWSSFSILFVAASALILLSSVPLFRIKEIHSHDDFSYRRLFRELVDDRHRRNFFAFLGFGEELIVMTIWPIFIYTVVQDYLRIGELVAVATFITGIAILYLAKLIDRYRKDQLLRAGSLLYFLSWLVRSFISRAWHVVALDAASRITKEMLFVPLEALLYRDGKQIGPLAYAIFLEQSVAVGKILSASAVIIVISIFSTHWFLIFAIAAAFSLLYMFYRHPKPYENIKRGNPSALQ